MTRVVVVVLSALTVAPWVSALTGAPARNVSNGAITVVVPRKRRDRFRPTFLSSSVLSDLRRYEPRSRVNARVVHQTPPNTTLSSTVALLYNTGNCSKTHPTPFGNSHLPPSKKPLALLGLLYSPP